LPKIFSKKFPKNWDKTGKSALPKEAKMRELERYAQELTQDISEMIEDASPEERQTLARKLGTLVSKINNV
jgi:hypothetical protein